MKIKSINMTVVICALGYFVDVYDLLLFGIVRIPSLKDLGVSPDSLLSEGLRLLNYQMMGLLIGGVIWGILGDRRGRKSVLFGSIFLYSIANILNAFVTNTDQYAVLRFIAGIGLAGELGAAVTLVSEIMSRETRGLGTAIIAGVGISGAVVASLVGDYFSWQIAYIVGGSMGLALLFLRATMMESSMFDKLKKTECRKGAFQDLFLKWSLFKKYIGVIAIGLPLWCVVGILVTFSPEITRSMGIEGVSAGKSVMWAYGGATLGDLIAGFVSNWLQSRKKTVWIFLTLTTLFVGAMGFAHGISLSGFYFLCVLWGLGAGYWATFVTIAAEQFGTNLRATVATTAPNFVRGAVVPMALAFNLLKGNMSILSAALTVTGLSLLIAYFFLWNLDETFGKDLDYIET